MKAFPQRVSTEYQYQVEHGMDLRDYFAAKAMQALVSRTDTPLLIDCDLLATNSYSIADAMMKAREQ